ncbi:hypothetical protein KKQ10_25180 [Pseudomonas sp. MG-9]|uniref:hypothetical protein n=1 Tax=Pseudomonas TaxID=286 RepID=UPI001BFFE388|nr:hypothetical protein [Pseudomonas sp. MG-9]MBT9268175.1 hypothetical protein [Pseudomonas sp. MG-9]
MGVTFFDLFLKLIAFGGQLDECLKILGTGVLVIGTQRKPGNCNPALGKLHDGIDVLGHQVFCKSSDLT